MRLRRDVGASLALATALAGALAAAACSSANGGSPSSNPRSDAGSVLAAIQGRACPQGSTLNYENFGEPFFGDWCTGCHSSELSGEARRNAPAGFDFDTLAGIRAHLADIYAHAGDSNSLMPPAGGPSAELRQSLGDWLACGAPGQDNGFDVVPSDASAPPTPTGACAAPHMPVPASQLPRCTAATSACIAACTTNDCSAKCLASDTMPPDPTSYLNCQGCYFAQLLACADPQCHGPILEFLCCLANKCANGPADCASTQCSTEQSVFGLCLYYVTPTCANYGGPLTSECFAYGDADAGDSGG